MCFARESLCLQRKALAKEGARRHTRPPLGCQSPPATVQCAGAPRGSEQKRGRSPLRGRPLLLRAEPDLRRHCAEGAAVPREGPGTPRTRKRGCCEDIRGGGFPGRLPLGTRDLLRWEVSLGLVWRPLSGRTSVSHCRTPETTRVSYANYSSTLKGRSV